MSAATPSSSQSLRSTPPSAAAALSRVASPSALPGRIGDECGDEDDRRHEATGHCVGTCGLRRALLIAGPTASGKSAAALALARAFGATIVNADSMQVYADLRVLTARPTPDEEASAPHRLFGEIDGAINYSVGSWSRRAGEILAGDRRGAGHFRRRHRPLLPRPDGGPFRHARGPGGRARRDPRRGGGSRDRRPARRAGGARSGDGVPSEPLGPAADPARARSVRRDRPAARFVP